MPEGFASVNMVYKSKEKQDMAQIVISNRTASYRSFQSSSSAPATLLAGGSLALLVCSLVLPVGYGAELFGVIYGGMLLFFSAAVPPLLVISLPMYALIPASAMMRATRPGWAFILSAIALAVWTFALIQQGPFINAFLSNRQIPATGIFCGIGSSFLMVLSTVMDVRWEPSKT